MDNPDSSFTESEKKEEIPDLPDGVLKKLGISWHKFKQMEQLV